eukprot:3606126-Amphidinium_carterae.1
MKEVSSTRLARSARTQTVVTEYAALVQYRISTAGAVTLVASRISVCTATIALHTESTRHETS